MSVPLRLLLVEDEENDAVLLIEEVSRGGFAVTYERVETLDALRSALMTGSWDLMISDFSLPTLTALDSVKLAQELRPDLPCIVMSGTIDENAAVGVLRRGARDFIVKDRMARLLPAIRRELDESQKRQAAQETARTLEATRDRMQMVLEMLEIGTFEFDVHANMVIGSEIFSWLHGLPPGEFVGPRSDVVATLHPDDRRPATARTDQAVRDRTEIDVEYRVVRPDGSVRWLFSRAKGAYDSEGRPLRRLGICQDITEKKQLEHQLHQAQKMESIGVLAGGVAHDFNNLLTVITGYVQLMMERWESDPQLTFELNEIRHATESATALTRQLLAFSRKQILAPQSVDVNRVVNAFERMMRRLVEEHVNITVTLAPTLDPVYADPRQLEQVLLNLVVNARDAMPTGGELEVRTRNVNLDADYAVGHVNVLPGSYVELTVSDTGHGMTAEVKQRLFEPFFTTKERGRGTGLGLSTVYGIVTQSKGHISVRSEPGQGTTFTIHLPVMHKEQEVAEAAPRKERADVGGGETVLVVEDDERLRALDEVILSRYGYAPLMAAGGEEMQRICSAHCGPIHAALVDVVLADGSGRAVGEWIRAHRPETQVIFMSGYTHQAISQHGVLEPGVTLLQKPFSPAELARVLREALAASRGDS